MRNKRLLQRYSRIGNSLTGIVVGIIPKVEKDIQGLGTNYCQRLRKIFKCCWHSWIKIREPGTSITSYLGVCPMILHCAMYFGLSLHALIDSDITSQ